MQIKLPLDEMTKEEKLRVMEDIWKDLTRTGEDYPSPEWHQDVLKLREERIKEGKEKYNDWEESKKDLRNKLL